MGEAKKGKEGKMDELKPQLTPQEEEKALYAMLEEGINELVSNSKYHEYLDAMARFHDYSERNIMLIYKQMPEATMVAAYATWKKLKRSVMLGKKSRIKIFAPIAPKAKKVKKQKEDFNTGEPILDENGKVVFEEITVQEEPKFQPLAVFDISQTHGESLPRITDEITTDAQLCGAFMQCLTEISDMPIVFEELMGRDGLQYDNKIAINIGMSQSRSLAAIIQEISYSKLFEQEKNRANAEIEALAESVAYVVCKKFSVETSINPFDNIAKLTGGDTTKIKEAIKVIKENAGQFIASIEDKFIALCKEKGLESMAEYEPHEHSNTQITVEQIITAKDEQENEIEQESTKVKTSVSEEKRVDEQAQEKQENSISVQAIQHVKHIKEPEPADTVAEVLPLPDPAVPYEEIIKCAKIDKNIIPLRKTKAKELFSKDFIVYRINNQVEGTGKDKNLSMAFYAKDIDTHNGTFAILKSQWHTSDECKELQRFRSKTAIDAMKESEFINATESKVAVYEPIIETGEIARENYKIKYTAPVKTIPGFFAHVQETILNFIKEASPSDIISINIGGNIYTYKADGNSDVIKAKRINNFTGNEKTEETIDEIYEEPQDYHENTKYDLQGQAYLDIRHDINEMKEQMQQMAEMQQQVLQMTTAQFATNSHNQALENAHKNINKEYKNINKEYKIESNSQGKEEDDLISYRKDVADGKMKISEVVVFWQNKNKINKETLAPIEQDNIEFIDELAELCAMQMDVEIKRNRVPSSIKGKAKYKFEGAIKKIRSFFGKERFEYMLAINILHRETQKQGTISKDNLKWARSAIQERQIQYNNGLKNLHENTHSNKLQASSLILNALVGRYRKLLAGEEMSMKIKQTELLNKGNITKKIIDAEKLSKLKKQAKENAQ